MSIKGRLSLEVFCDERKLFFKWQNYIHELAVSHIIRVPVSFLYFMIV